LKCDGQVILNWNSVASASGYYIKRSLVSGGSYTAVFTNLVSTTFTNTGLANGTTYYYVVSAGNPAGEGANSSEASARPVSFTRTAVSATVAGGQLQLAWPQDHTGWQLQAQTNPFGPGLSTNWVSVFGSKSTNQLIMGIGRTNGSVFYRLVYP
jgi:cellulose 1,4-beta-cellobiosidase